MGEFFQSKKFKILISILIVLFAFMIRALASGGLSTIVSSITGAVVSPMQEVSSSVSESVTDFFGKYINAGKIIKQNEELKNQIATLNKKMVDFEKYKNENKNLKKYLEIKDINPDFEFEPATVIGRDPMDKFKSFTINKGTMNNIKVHDTVITSSGLVGIVIETGMTYSKVMTILDVGIQVGATNSRTQDVGVITGDALTSTKLQTTLKYIPKNSSITKGDIIITTGASGIFPQGIIIGKVDSVENESHGKSLFAKITPTQDIENVREVFVIKSFLGQSTSQQKN